jgi:hypothetical protein
MLKDTNIYIGVVVSNLFNFIIIIIELGVIGNMVGRTLGDIAKAQKNILLR